MGPTSNYRPLSANANLFSSSCQTRNQKSSLFVERRSYRTKLLKLESLLNGDSENEAEPVSGRWVFMADLEKQERGGDSMGGGAEECEEERFLEGMAVLDFDLLCSTVALQTQGKWRKLENEEDGEEGGEFGGVLRMWEGEVLDCFEDHRISFESSCCPCHRFGKNMRRAGFGSCFIQGTVYLLLALVSIINCIAFIVTNRHCFLYLSLGFALSVGTYLGFFRTKMRKKFNIRGGDTSFDDCIYHLICPCCTLSQESRTLEINNVQDGTWHGRGDTRCIGSCIEGNRQILELHPPPSVSIELSKPALETT